MGYLSVNQDDYDIFVSYAHVDDFPLPLADLKFSRFWSLDQKTGTPRLLGDPVPNAEYYGAIDDLTREIVAELKRRKHVEGRSAAASALASNGTVFLAEVTDDLDDQRN